MIIKETMVMEVAMAKVPQVKTKMAVILEMVVQQENQHQ